MGITLSNGENLQILATSREIHPRSVKIAYLYIDIDLFKLSVSYCTKKYQAHTYVRGSDNCKLQ